MTQRNFARIAIVLVIALLAVNVSIETAQALGISPPITIIAYHPGVEYSNTFKAINKEDYPMSVRVRATGSLADYVTFDQSEMVVPSRSSRQFRYFVTPPADLEPGTHELRLHVEEHIAPESFLTSGSTGASALSAAAMIFQVKSPFPNEYLELRLQPINDINFGETAYFQIETSNFGSVTLTDLQADVEIISGTTTVANLKSSTIDTLTSLDVQQLRAYWDTGNHKAGPYDVIVRVDYGGAEIAETRGNFHIGDVFLSILGVVVRDVESNRLAKFVINVKSEWSEPMEKVYAEVYVTDSQGQDMGFGQSKFVNIPPQATSTLTALWDTPELFEDEEYTANIKVFYDDDKTAEKTITFTMADSQSGLDLTTAVMLVAGVAVILLALLMFLRRKSKKKRRRK